MKLLQAAVLIAALATTCLAAHHAAIETYGACMDHSIPEPLKNKTVSEIQKQYAAYLVTTNAPLPDRQKMTVMKIISHAVNATGNASETMSRLGINRIGCMGYFQLSLTEVALLNLKNPDKFPGNINVKDLFDLLITNRTESVLINVQVVITQNFENKTYILNKTISELIETSPFTNQTDLLKVLRYAINASSANQTSKELAIPLEYLSEPMNSMTEYLFESSAYHFQELSLESLIQRLHFSKNWLYHLIRFKKVERMKVQDKTMNDLFEKEGLDKENTTILSLLEKTFPTDALNWTLLQFLGMRRVSLQNFNYTFDQWKGITFLHIDFLGNSTLLQIFGHAFAFDQVFNQYRMNIKLAKSRKEMILGKYNVTTSDLMEPPLNLAYGDIDASGDRELESFSIRVHLKRYADGRNITIEELENLSNITTGQLTNATVDNFVPNQFKIAQSNVIRAITKERALAGIVPSFTPLCFENLKTQIQNNWQPLTIDWIKMINISISYFIYQAKLNPQSVLNMSFYYFFENHLSYESISFRELLKLFPGIIYQHHIKLEEAFKNYSFDQLQTFIGLKQFEIFSWKLEFFIKHISMGILNDTNECNRNRNPCAMITGVTCSNRIFGYKCNCPGGMNLNENKGCRDIDECSTWSDQCSYLAVCTNTLGSYRCSCRDGYIGTGLTCGDIDECQQEIHTCPRNSDCNNTIGSHICQCKNGFQKDGNRCVDINECRLGTATCRNNSRCENTIGSYRCPCDVGFEDVNDTCKDVDECRRSNNRACYNGADNFQCKNTFGSFTCVCNPGFRFDHEFRVCRDINECLEQKPCRTILYSNCQNKEPKYMCTCLPGFKEYVDVNGTLVNCTDIDECSNRSCDQNAVCSNTLGSYNCHCKEGYKRDGVECKVAKIYKSPPGIVPRVAITYVKFRTPTKFYYNEKLHDTIHISDDGFIVIGNRRYWSSPKRLTSLNEDVIAPFWSFTALYTSMTYFELVKGDPRASPLLNKINQFVKNSTKEANFSASWAIVVTWEKVKPFWYNPRWWRRSDSPYASETNTFQAVITVQRKKTCVFLLYEDMKWRTDRGRKAVAGYSTKTGNNGYQVRVSFQPDMFRIDQQDFTDPAGNVRKGSIIWLFKEQTQQELSPVDKCLEWIRKESGKDNDWIIRFPKCPCIMDLVSWDNRFINWFSQDPDVMCYITRNTSSYSRTCCYDDFGALLSSPDNRAGRTFRYGPRNLNYFRNEEEPYQWCCLRSNEYCEDFEQLRPRSESCDVDPDEQGECPRCGLRFGFRYLRPRRRRGMRLIRRAFTWGDPHITTVDGFKYTFNGLGDYVMLKTNDTENFNAIHTRTKRPKNKSGGLSRATVFSGFALRSSKNTTVQVFFDSSVDGNLSITTVNQSINCQTFGLPDINKHQIDGFTLVNRSNTLVLVYDSGLSVEITPELDLLQFSLSIPTSSFENRTLGLLGKLNEDVNDDLILRNGTMMSINSTDKEIFAYGNDWEVQPDERLFVNITSCQKMDVLNSNFEPIFLSDVRENVTEEMLNTCQGNNECLLDYFVTGDSSFAKATLDYETQNQKIKKIFDNRPPSIVTSPKEPQVTVGQMTIVNVTVSDPDKDTIIELLVHGLSGLNATFNNATSTAGILTWTPGPGLDKVNIRFIAKDSNGAATSHNLIVRYCDCKNTGNTCIFETIQKTYVNSSLSLVECNCTQQYTGVQCQTEINPCDDKPCYNENITCNVTRSPFGSQCGPCPKGLEGDGKICNDYDECLLASRNNCTENEICVNTIGSYRCQCKNGFSRESASQKCLDVNECNSPFLDTYKCKANTDCKNTLGSYNCSCKKGFKGDPLTECTDINECQGNDKICFSPSCENSIGSFKCSCSTGFELKRRGNNLFCKDKDECQYPSDNNCEQTCVNNEGSYACACSPGFQLAGDGHSCVVKNSSKCDTTNGGCQKLCTNSSGTVTCYCPRGFNLSSDGKNCEDVNECMTHNGGCSQKCNNFVGSYRCSCHSGYKLKGARLCEDINECLGNNGDCAQKCHNKPGGRDCSCKKGYVLKTSDNKTCEDINECTNNVHKCGQYRVCNNALGGYSCICRDRTLFSNGKFKCRRSRKFIFVFSITMTYITDYDDEYSDKSIALIEVIVEKSDSFFRTKFKEAYLGCSVVGKFRRGSVRTNVSLNFDANSTVSANDLSNAVKNVNNLGGLRIDPSNSAVSDLDECSDPSLNNCHKDATCTNKPGTFSCKCKDGYEGDGISCKVSAIPEKKDKDDEDKTIMIILLCTLIPLAVIIIIITIVCCYCRRRRNKRNLYAENTTVQMYHTTNMYGTSIRVNKDSYYNDAHRRGSDDSSTNARDYDIAQPSSTFAKQDSSEMYEVPEAQYYDNPAVYNETRH